MELKASINFEMYDERGNYHGVRDTADFDAEQTRTILDTLPVGHLERFIEDDTTNESGDDIFYSAEAMAMLENHYGDSFTAYLNSTDEKTITAYLADRAKRGIPEDGVDIDHKAFQVQATIQKINDLISTLPEDGSVLWLSTDGSWGGATDLSLYWRGDLSEDVRESYEIED